MSVICLNRFNSTLLTFFIFFFPVEHPKPVRLSPSSTAKRTGSLDTIAGPYLTGHWPRCDVTVCNPLLAAQPQDKATQVSRSEGTGIITPSHRPAYTFSIVRPSYC